MLRNDIAEFLNSFLEIEKVVGDSPNGLIVQGKPDVFTAGTATNATLRVIRASIRSRVDFLLTHHGGWQEIYLENFDSKKELLQKHGISLYVAHACLDNSEKVGTAKVLANLLGVQIQGRFAEYCGGKAGVYGSLESVSLREFAKVVSTKLGARVKAWRNSTNSVSKLAILTGGGYKTEWLSKARQLGCETYLTGEGSLFTKVYASESKMNLILAGHTATERPAILELGRVSQSTFPSLKLMAIPEALL